MRINAITCTDAQREQSANVDIKIIKTLIKIMLDATFR